MINYYLITKPGIILGNLITVAAGFLLASKGALLPSLFLATLLGMTLIIASACVFNNYIDRPLDLKMDRTQKRPLAQGLISGWSALIFATLLLCLGNLVLFMLTNTITLLLANLGFFVYVIPYSLWSKQTLYGTAVGSIAGALPPLIGYAAVSNSLDLGAVILFAILVFWQMPHFFSIAINHFEDYKRAKIPVLPISKGIDLAKTRMTLYIILFTLSSISLSLFHYTGYFFLAASLVLGTFWLLLNLGILGSKDNKRWGEQMFRFSLLTITILSLIIPFDTIAIK